MNDRALGELHQVRPLTFAIYPFEGALPALASPTIAARRALDHAGLRLSVEGWRSLPLDARTELTVAGGRERVDTDAVAQIASAATPPPSRVDPRPDPSREAPPEIVSDVPGWADLRGLDRYALVHVRTKAAARSSYGDLPQEEGHILTLAARAGTGSEPEPEPELDVLDLPVSDLTPISGTSEPVSVISSISSHLTDAGEVHMVDVAAKPTVARRAIARGAVRMRAETLERLARHEVPKGEVLGTARVAGILAAKRTPEIIPLCHHVALTHVEVSLDLALDGDGEGEEGRVEVTATVDALDRTGCEMEALFAVSAACLTVYDMLKGIDRDMEITGVVLLEKEGGRSGHYRRGEVAP